MASRVAVAIRQQQAAERMTAAALALGERFGVKPGELSPRHRDPGIEQAMRLESIAAFLEGLAAADPVQEAPAKPAVQARSKATK